MRQKYALAAPDTVRTSFYKPKHTRADIAFGYAVAKVVVRAAYPRGCCYGRRRNTYSARYGGRYIQREHAARSAFNGAARAARVVEGYHEEVCARQIARFIV